MREELHINMEKNVESSLIAPAEAPHLAGLMHDLWWSRTCCL